MDLELVGQGAGWYSVGSAVAWWQLEAFSQVDGILLCGLYLDGSCCVVNC